MAKSQQSFNKRDKEKKRRKKREEKLERKRLRKLEKEESGPKSFEDMLAYVDENGNLTSTPPDPNKRKKIKAEDIVLGIPKKEGIEEETVRKGKVKFFNQDKGYGFITDSSSQESIFVHINDVDIPLQENDKVTFEIEMGPKGPKAVLVRLQ
jgi:cold shock CspA family protein